MRLFGPSALDLIRAQRQGVEDYCDYRRAQMRGAGSVYSQKQWRGKLHIAWKCGWSQAEELERLCAPLARTATTPRPIQQPKTDDGMEPSTRNFVAMCRALGFAK